MVRNPRSVLGQVYAKLRASADMAERYQHPQAAEGERSGGGEMSS